MRQRFRSISRRLVLEHLSLHRTWHIYTESLQCSSKEPCRNPSGETTIYFKTEISVIRYGLLSYQRVSTKANGSNWSNWYLSNFFTRWVVQSSHVLRSCCPQRHKGVPWGHLRWPKGQLALGRKGWETPGDRLDRLDIAEAATDSHCATNSLSSSTGSHSGGLWRFVETRWNKMKQDPAKEPGEPEEWSTSSKVSCHVSFLAFWQATEATCQSLRVWITASVHITCPRCHTLRPRCQRVSGLPATIYITLRLTRSASPTSNSLSHYHTRTGIMIPLMRSLSWKYVSGISSGKNIPHLCQITCTASEA